MAAIDLQNLVWDGSAWQKLSAVSLDSGTAYGIKAQMYGDYSGTPKKIAVDTNGYAITSPIVRTQQGSKTNITNLTANALYELTAAFDALAFTRLAGSLESDRFFYFLINQGEDTPLNDIYKYQSVWYPTLTLVHPASSVFQTETATVAGTCTGTGTVTAIVTSATMTNSPKTVTINVVNGDTAAIMANKIRAGLRLDPDVAAYYSVGGVGVNVILIDLLAEPNDATLNIALNNGTATGLTAAASSANTTAGTATKQVETATAAGTITLTGNATVIVTSANMSNSPKTISVAVTNTDTASTWAGKVRTALLADVDVASAFDVSGATTAIILTAIEYLANDSTLNISLANGTCTGITAAPTSANTTAGVVGSLYRYVAAYDQELVHRYVQTQVYIGPIVPAFFRYSLYPTSVVR